MWSRLLQTVSHFFYPEQCLGCGMSGTALCNQCIQSIPLSERLEDHHDFAVFDYGNKLVRQAVWQLKYRRRAEAAKLLAAAAAVHASAFIAEILQSTELETLVFVPMAQHRHKKLQRGYNQSLLLAQWLAAGIPGTCVRQLLHKIVDTPAQARLKYKAARKQNVAHSMSAKTALDPSAVYVIIDDVTTTGVTMCEARRTLRQSGGKKILSVALAHGYFST